MIRNNILAFGREQQMQRTRVEPHLSFTFTGNIVYWSGGPLFAGQWKDANVRLEKNLYFNTAGPIDFAGRELAAWQQSGQRSLKLTDAAGLKQQFDPHLYFRPNHSSGTTHCRFALRLSPGAVFHHEWRDDANPYRRGPSLLIQNGKLLVANGKMTDAEKKEYPMKFEAEIISPADVELWKRGASNAGYHYLGCANTFALMGKAFAEANLAMWKDQ